MITTDLDSELIVLTGAVLQIGWCYMMGETQVPYEAESSPLLNFIGVPASVARVPMIERAFYDDRRQRLSRECHERFREILFASGSTSYNGFLGIEGD